MDNSKWGATGLHVGVSAVSFGLNQASLSFGFAAKIADTFLRLKLMTVVVMTKSLILSH